MDWFIDMEELIDFLNNNNITYSTQYNVNNELVVDFLTYEIIADGEWFCVAATNTMNFMWMTLSELELWLHGITIEEN